MADVSVLDGDARDLGALAGPAPPTAARRRDRVVADRYPVRDLRIRRMLGAADALSVMLALLVAVLVGGYRVAHVVALLVAVPLLIVVFKCYGLYDGHVRRIAHSWIDEIPRAFHAVLVGSLLLWGLSWLDPRGRLGGAPTVAFALTLFVVLPLLRTASLRVAAARLGRERLLLVGDDSELTLLVRKIRAHPEYQLEPVGSLSHAPLVDGAHPLPVLGEVGSVDARELVRRHAVGRVLLSRRGLDRDDVVDLIRTCNELRVKVSYLPQDFEGLGPATEVDDIEGVTVLGLNPPVMTRSSRALKRSMDIVGATLLLLATAPLMAGIALLIRLTSPGPALFTQERIGRGGRRFRLIKFRTMVVGAEERQAELRAQSTDPGWLLIDNDPRVTSVGRLLRSSSLDELPQLLNVLRGEMSLVGPRPIIESEDRQLEGWRRSRVDLTPGLTGMWQVLGRTSIPFEEMITLDYLYVTNWSLWTDIRLILRTFTAVFSRRGVN